MGPPTPELMTPEMETSAAKLFALMDANGNGFVVEKELQRHLSLAGISLAKDRTVLPTHSKNFRLFQQKIRGFLFHSHIHVHTSHITSVYIERLRIASTRKKSPIFLIYHLVMPLNLRPFGRTTTGSNSSTSLLRGPAT